MLRIVALVLVAAVADASVAGIVEHLAGREVMRRGFKELREVEDPWPWALTIGLRAGYPQIAGIAVGAILDGDIDELGTTAGWAPMVEVEAAIGGGKASLGIGRVDGGFGVPHWIIGALWAPELKATVLRTWGDLVLEPDQTFVGPELGFSCYGVVTIGVGALFRVQGDAPDEEWTVSASIGIGL
ncbi:MAG TPA: hypothetical protein VEL07_21950 [Planctomycetota bacterium]|nr:hypothetical protein [Planctomycetota bacterium]